MRCEHGADLKCECGQCYCSVCSLGDECPDCLRRDFVGLAERPDYQHFVSEVVEGGTVSPGGASAMLRISRQRVHELMSEGKLRFWRYFSRDNKLPEMIDISVRSVVRHGVNSGRIKSYEDFGLKGPQVKREYERLRGLTNIRG